jgi:hypothetical protein
VANISMVFVKDLAERVVVTFLEAWVGAWLLLVDHQVDQLFDPKLLGAAVAAAGLALLKGLGARQVGAPESASLSPDV